MLLFILQLLILWISMRVTLPRLVGLGMDLIDFVVFIWKEGGAFEHWNLDAYEIIQYKHWDALP